jgi:hypothetical protein
MAILVMLNSYLHDLATAVFAVSPVVAGLVRLGLFSLAWTLFFGIIRGLTYRQYEWMEAAGRDQVAALVVKHVILVFLVVLGFIALRKVRRIEYAPASEQVSR